MSETALPQGRYFSCAFRIAPDAGGQTRALLSRNRILALEGGVRPDLLMLGAEPDLPGRRASLVEHGLLVEGVRLLNIYEHYRDHGWGDREPTGELADLRRHRIAEETTPDGAPWRNVYQLPDAERPIFEYLRADGSPYLRIPRYSKNHRFTWPRWIQQVDADGAVVGEFTALGQWFRRWIRDLLGDGERAFVFIDSRFLVPHLVPMRGHRVHLIYQMHNVHVGPPRRWNSDVDRIYKRVLDRIDGMDAMVTLTERQRDDIAARRGRTSNLFVVPNPIVMPAPPVRRAPRDPSRVTIVARLERQKRLTDAIAAFQQVVEAIPHARLDIYGEGRERERLQSEIQSRGLGEAVVLRGFDPRASDALWTSSAFLMTSAFEGYPLSTIESMSRGCPVVSYDIKYGPREQITDGVDGFLVAAGDVDRLAQRVIELLRSPELVARIGAAATERAKRFGPAECLASWASVLQASVERKPLRTRIDRMSLELTQLCPVRFQRLQLNGVVKVEGESRRSSLKTAALELAAVNDASGHVTELPLSTRLSRDGAFKLRARIKLADVFRGGPEVRLRLRCIWQNSSSETDVALLSAEEGLQISPTAEPAHA
jgi:poly(glycerol-phosphate) alpha-glucosyltransferase